VALALALLWTSRGSACPFCTADRGASLQYYFGATILLSLVPLAIFGSILIWLRRSARRAATDFRATVDERPATAMADTVDPLRRPRTT